MKRPTLTPVQAIINEEIARSKSGYYRRKPANINLGQFCLAVALLIGLALLITWHPQQAPQPAKIDQKEVIRRWDGEKDLGQWYLQSIGEKP